VTVRAGDNEQTFALNGNAAPLNGLVVEFSGGGAFTTLDAQDYQSVVVMMVKKYVNGVEDTWTPDGSVTWTVTSAISGLSTGTEGVWKRASNAKNGLMWVASAVGLVFGDTGWYDVNGSYGFPVVFRRVSFAFVYEGSGSSVFGRFLL
jgi:hypothetical protein